MPKLGDSLTITLGVTAKVLTKINGPSNYSSEYLLKETLQDFRCVVRHSKTGGKNGKPTYDRHNLEVVQTVYATATVPEFYRKFYFVYECLPTDEATDLADAIGDLVIADTAELIDELLDWQS